MRRAVPLRQLSYLFIHVGKAQVHVAEKLRDASCH